MRNILLPQACQRLLAEAPSYSRLPLQTQQPPSPSLEGEARPLSQAAEHSRSLEHSKQSSKHTARQRAKGTQGHALERQSRKVMVFSSGQMVGVDEQRSERGPHRYQHHHHRQQQQQQEQVRRECGGEEQEADSERYRFPAISAPPPSRSVGWFEKLLRRCVLNE
jgi:hypothetical protein